MQTAREKRAAALETLERLSLNRLLEKDSLAFDIGAASPEKLAHVRREIAAVRERIHCEINLAAWREPPLQIAQEKVPFLNTPSCSGLRMSIETNRECGDPIELLLEFRERLERRDSENDSGNIEDFEQLAKEWRFIDVEAENGMIESLQDEQKKSATAAEVEDVLWRCAMQFQILDSFAIYPEPMIDIGVFRASVALRNFAQTILIDAGEHRPEWQAKDGALRAPPTAPITFTTEKLTKFSGQLHTIASAISRNRPGP